MYARRAASLIVAAASLSVVAGCNNKKSTSSAALDIAEPTPVYAAPQPVAPRQAPRTGPGGQQAVAQPVINDTQQYRGFQSASGQHGGNPTMEPGMYAPAPAGQPMAGDAMAGSSYTVRRGDTLFSIAKTRYGNGNQWQRIAAANPGLTPQNLKAGQTIMVP